MKKIMRKKGVSLVPNTLIGWLITLLALALFFVLVAVLSIKIFDAGSFLKSVFKLG